MNNDLIDWLKNNENVIYEDSFFELLKETSLMDFRRNINIVQNIKPSFFLEKRVIKYYDELLSQYNEKNKLFFKYEKIIQAFNDNDYEFLRKYDEFDYLLDRMLLVTLQDYWHYSDKLELIHRELHQNTNMKISEIIIDGLFGDNIYNVWLNIREMLRYNSLSDKNLLDKEKEMFYRMILNIDELDCSEKIIMYNNLKDKNISLMFYQDLRCFKDISYNDIKDKLFKVSNHNNLLNKELSLQFGIPIYKLETEHFYMLISCRQYFQPIDSIRRHCYTLISDFNLEVYKKDKFIYGYVDFDINSILHVFEKDSYSSNGNGTSRSSFTTKRVNRIMKPGQICNSSGYSEIQIVNKKINDNEYEVMRPSYLVVFDEILDKHIDEAKRIGIPIIVIDTKYYYDSYKNDELNKNLLDEVKYESIRDNYTEDSFQEEIKRTRRLYQY